jgi:predicted component of type VI protein secretion system
MAAVLRLTVVTGPHKNERFCLCAPAHCVVGRAKECAIQLAGSWRDDFISRRHCELIMEPASLVLKDLGSSNGTYVNGAKIDLLELPLIQPCQDSEDRPAFHQGGLLTVGGTTFRMEFVECPPKDIDSETQPFWQDGECIKKACPIQC